VQTRSSSFSALLQGCFVLSLPLPLIVTVFMQIVGPAFFILSSPPVAVSTSKSSSSVVYRQGQSNKVPSSAGSSKAGDNKSQEGKRQVSGAACTSKVGSSTASPRAALLTQSFSILEQRSQRAHTRSNRSLCSKGKVSNTKLGASNICSTAQIRYSARYSFCIHKDQLGYTKVTLRYRPACSDLISLTSVPKFS
jgi:hypothetical protein